MNRQEWEEISNHLTKEEQQEYLKLYFQTLEGLLVVIKAEFYNDLRKIGIRKGFSE